jgi:hypothetical protein
MELLVAYQLGSYPSLVGIHFNIMELLRRVADTPSLQAHVNEQAQRLAARRKETVELVLFTEQMCDRVKLQKPPRPQTYAEYEAWADSISRQALAAAGPSVHETAAFHLGHNLGDLELTLMIGGIADAMRVAAPDDPFLTAQAAQLGASEVKDRKNLELLALSPALPDSTLALLKDVTGILAGLEGENVDRTAMFRSIEAKRTEIGRSFMPPSQKG